MKILDKEVINADVPVVLAASGPSLDAYLPWLYEHQNSINLVASGSALGALLRAGIRPSLAVFLERDAGVYSDLCDLMVEGHTFEGITVYKQHDRSKIHMPFLRLFFYRPIASASVLFLMIKSNPSHLWTASS